jgi:hypothetical protein
MLPPMDCPVATPPWRCVFFLKQLAVPLFDDF